MPIPHVNSPEEEVMPLLTKENLFEICEWNLVATGITDKAYILIAETVTKAQHEADLKVLDKIKAGWVETYNEQVVICRNLREAHGLELEAERKKWAENERELIEAIKSLIESYIFHCPEAKDNSEAIKKAEKALLHVAELRGKKGER